MAIPAIPLGCASPICADKRQSQSAGHSNGAQALFNSGRAWHMATTTTGASVLYCQSFEASGVMADGDSIFLLWEYLPTSAINGAGSETPWAGALQGDRNATAGGWAYNASAVCLAGIVESSLSCSVIFQDGTGANTAGNTNFAPLSLIAKSWLGMKITRVSSTQATVIPYLNGAAGTTLTHNNAGGLGTLNFKTFRAGNSLGLAKGGTLGMEVGNGFYASDAMPDSTSVIVHGLTTSDGATLEWTKGSGGTGSYTEWDDALGSYSATDYNTTGSQTTAKKQISGFAALSIPSDAAVKIVTPYATSSLNGTTVDATRQIGTTANATDLEKDITFSGDLAALFTNGGMARHFETRGDASAWTPATVDSDVFYVRQAAAGGAREWQVFAHGKLCWYVPAVAAGTRRIFLC